MSRETQNGAAATAAPETTSPEQEMPSNTTSYTNSTVVATDEGHDVAAINSEVSHHLTPSAFSDAIDAIGMGPFQNRMILMCGMGFAIDAIEIVVISFVLEDIAISFNLDAVGKGSIGSASFLGMLIGAGFWSVYADKYGRRSAFVISLAFVFIGGVISAASPSLLVLCICRVAVGFGVGGNIPVTTALLTEFLPTSHRGHVMCRLAGTFWGVGMLAASGLGLILTIALGSGQEEMFWRWFLGMAALPSAVVAVAYNILPESPRFLQVMERHDEALEVLEYVARTNGKLDAIGLESGAQTSGNSHTAVPTSSPGSRAPAFEVTYHAKIKQPPGENSVLADLRDGGGANPMVVTARAADNTKAGDVRDLFHTPILRRVTLCLWVVWLFLDLSYYGVTFMLPVFFAKITGGKRYDEFLLYFLMGITYIPGASVAMVLCSEYCLGRVGSLKWSSFATAALIIVMATATDASVVFVVLTLVTMFVMAIPGTIMFLATPELYTTKYRAVGLGSCSVVSRVGGLVAPILVEVLYDKGGAVAPLVVFGPMMIITGIAAALIPIETAGRKLDDDSWDRKTPNLEPMEDAFIVSDVRV